MRRYGIREKGLVALLYESDVEQLVEDFAQCSPADMAVLLVQARHMDTEAFASGLGAVMSRLCVETNQPLADEYIRMERLREPFMTFITQYLFTLMTELIESDEQHVIRKVAELQCRITRIFEYAICVHAAVLQYDSVWFAFQHRQQALHAVHAHLLSDETNDVLRTRILCFEVVANPDYS